MAAVVQQQRAQQQQQRWSHPSTLSILLLSLLLFTALPTSHAFLFGFLGDGDDAPAAAATG